jgi:hypothetical protein
MEAVPWFAGENTFDELPPLGAGMLRGGIALKRSLGSRSPMLIAKSSRFLSSAIVKKGCRVSRRAETKGTR